MAFNNIATNEKTIKLETDAPYSYESYIDENPDISRWDPKLQQGGIEPLKSLIDLIKNYSGKGGVVIGLLGNWGTGKTSILKGAQYYFQAIDRQKVLFFDVWKYQAEENPVIPLLQKLIELGPTEQVKQNIKTILRTTLLAGADVLLGNLSKGTLDVSKIQEYTRMQEEIGDIVLKRLSIYDTLAKKISDAIKIIKGSEEEKFILIIDDLDRCLPDVAVKLLEGLRFYFEESNAIIILGLNEEVIAKYLEDVYWLKSGKPLIDGSQFLKKLFDWNIELPKIISDLIVSYYFKKSGKKIEDIFHSLGPLSYRTWKKIANRYKSSPKDISPIYAAFEAILVECFPKMDTYLRNNPGMKELLRKNLKDVKLSNPQLKKKNPEIFAFLQKTEENIWNEPEQGKTVIKRLRNKIW